MQMKKTFKPLTHTIQKNMSKTDHTLKYNSKLLEENIDYFLSKKITTASMKAK